MYADDIVLLSQTANGLQKLLCRLEDFCTRWNLKVNIDKTKVIIFNKSGRILKGHNFLFGYNMIKLVNEAKIKKLLVCCLPTDPNFSCDPIIFF